jgi:hypothetical protein
MIGFDFADTTTFLYHSWGNMFIKVKQVVQADVKRLYYKRQFAIDFIAI